MKDRLETATTVRCVPWKVAAPVIRQSVCAAPAPGLWQREDFYFSKYASIPLANLEAITTDSTMSYGSLLLHQKHVRRNAASSECKVGEMGNFSYQTELAGKEKKGNKETTKQNQDMEKLRGQST